MIHVAGPSITQKKAAPNRGQGGENIMVYKFLQTISVGFSKRLYQIDTQGSFVMFTQRLGRGICLGALVMTSACSAAPNGLASPPAGPQAAADTARGNVTGAQLPINRRFRTLDEYLAYLEKTQAPIDKPWYKQIRPGVYELAGGNFRPLGGDPKKRIFTRAELEKKFGFSR
jgi:hypothetical protein